MTTFRCKRCGEVFQRDSRYQKICDNCNRRNLYSLDYNGKKYRITFIKHEELSEVNKK